MSDEIRVSLDLPSDADASGRSFGEEELAQLKAVIDSGTLNSTKGTAVKQLEQRFAAYVGVEHAWACASGTAAVHTAVAAIDPEPGDEIVTTPITDMIVRSIASLRASCALGPGADPVIATRN